MMIDSTYDITLNDRISLMTLEEKAKFLAGIDKHGEEDRTDVEKWIRYLNSSVVM